MHETSDAQIEFLNIVLSMSEKSDLMLASIEKKLDENPNEDQIPVNAKALLKMHFLLTTYRTLTNNLVEENQKMNDNLAAFLDKILKT